MSLPSAIQDIAGRAVVLPGADIDTDRIMPARFLKAITFDGLEQHLFADDRAAAAREGLPHPLDVAGAEGARILVTGANFGCGSSREHAPQALGRWGFRAIIAESFSPIFAGNALAIGLVCATVTPPDLADVMALVTAKPQTWLEINLDTLALSASYGNRWPLSVPDDRRHALLSGQWDGTSLLLGNYAEVERVEARLPYLRTTPRNA